MHFVCSHSNSCYVWGTAANMQNHVMMDRVITALGCSWNPPSWNDPFILPGKSSSSHTIEFSCVKQKHFHILTFIFDEKISSFFGVICIHQSYIHHIALRNEDIFHTGSSATDRALSDPIALADNGVPAADSPSARWARPLAILPDREIVQSQVDLLAWRCGETPRARHVSTGCAGESFTRYISTRGR